MKNLNNKQKIAIMKIILDIVMADEKVDDRETMFYGIIAEELGVDETMREAIKAQNSLLALVEINKLTDVQKRKFANLMGRMIVVDHNIHYNEVDIYNLVRDFCHIDVNLEDTFDVDEYPDLTITEEMDLDYEDEPEK